MLTKYFTMMDRLSSPSRWCRDTTIIRESLMEHTGWVATMAFHMSVALKQHGSFVDVGELLSKAILHDIEEGLTGDISGPTKSYSPRLREELKEMESDAIYCWMGFLEVSDRQYHALWDHSKDCSTHTGFLIKLCDYLAVVYKIWHEVCMMGNRGFIRVAKELLEYSPQSEQWNIPTFTDNANYYLDNLRIESNLIIHRIINGEKVEADEIPWLV